MSDATDPTAAESSRPSPNRTNPSTINLTVWAHRAILAIAVSIGGYIVLHLCSGLLYELKALVFERARARDHMPVGYIGIANEMPGMKPMTGCVQRSGDRTLLWAGQRNGTGPDTWFDVSGVTLPLHEFVEALGRDRIRAIDYPIYSTRFGTIAQRIPPEREVFAVRIDGDARAYPRTIMAKCELVNDIYGSRPVVVTYCPLLDEPAMYERSLDGVPVSLGTSGYVYRCAFVLYDRRTESLWIPEPRGLTAISGPLAGKVLARLEDPTRESWGTWSRRYPDSQVLIGADRKLEVSQLE